MTTSDRTNCVFYNALTRNGHPLDTEEVKLLQRFRELNANDVESYYQRSISIVRKFTVYPAKNQEFWQNITIRYVRPILDHLRTKNYEHAMRRINIMLDELEKEN